MEILPHREYVEFQTFISSYVIGVRVKRQFYLPPSYVRAYLRVPVYFILTFNAQVYRNNEKRYIFNSFSKIILLFVEGLWKFISIELNTIANNL